MVVVALAVRLPLLLGPQIDYDEGVYWASLRALAGGHGMFVPAYSSQPPAFLGGMLPFYLVLGRGITAARLGVLVFGVVALLATSVCARLLWGRGAGVVAALVMAVDPLAVRQSVTLQADGPALALGMVALACVLDARRRQGRRAAVQRVLAGMTLGLGALTKLSDVVFVVPVVFGMFLGSPRGWSWGRALAALAQVAVGGVVAAVAVLAPFAGEWNAMWGQVIGGHLTARSLHEGGLTHDMAVALWREAPFGLLALVGMAVLLWRRRVAGFLLVAWSAAVALFALAQHPLWPHHLVVAVPLMAMSVGALAAWLPLRRPAVRAAAVGGGVALCGSVLGLGVVALHDAFTADTHQGAPPLIAALTRPGDLVLSDDQWAVAAAGRDAPPELVDTSFVRLDSGHVTAAEVEAIIEREHVRAVYVATGRLDHLDGLLAWVRARTVLSAPAGGGAVVYVLGG